MTTTLQAADALTFARAHIGAYITPQGMCLNFVWRAYGSVPSVGDAVGKMGTAAGAWSVAKKKHLGDRNVPAGYWAYLGPSPTRTDANKNAGDVIISIGAGLFVCTDANGAFVGIMTLAAREAETQRPFVGWAEDLGGHPINGSVTVSTASSGAVVITPEAPEMEFDMASGMFKVNKASTKATEVGIPSGWVFQINFDTKVIRRVDEHGKEPDLGAKLAPGGKLPTIYGDTVRNLVTDQKYGRSGW